MPYKQISMFERDTQIDQGLVNVPGACSGLENGDIMCNSETIKTMSSLLMILCVFILLQFGK